MNKSNKTLALSTPIFAFISFFMMTMSSLANAEVNTAETIQTLACEVSLAADEKKNGEKGEDEEEPDCE